ncbi:MAG: hypothetical protein QM768_17910 [Agriterribacter sp.]
MNKLTSAFLLAFGAAIIITSCKKKDDDNGGGNSEPDKIVMVNNITTGSTPTAYLTTRKDLSAGSLTNAKGQQTVFYALAQTHGSDIYLFEARSGDKVKKFTRNADGSLTEVGSITMPANAFPYCIAFESDTKAYVNLSNTGKIAIINPTTMVQTGTIDLTSYALGDGSPDPGQMLYRDGKLYVGCWQTSDGTTSIHPAELLIIDVANNNQVTSITDNRTTEAGNGSAYGSMFFDETGDLYVLCMGSWGFVPGQKAGFLRLKSGATSFDPTYFFNTTDYSIANIPGNHIDYTHRVAYAGNGIAYITGNIPALMSNPPDYSLDKTFGAFKLDLAAQTITKLDIPYSNGSAAAVMYYQNKAWFGMSTSTAIGIYSYDPVTNTASAAPVVTTEGEPSVLCVFE